jgi:hypothetical protein
MALTEKRLLSENDARGTSAVRIARFRKIPHPRGIMPHHCELAWSRRCAGP